ncbi:MAG: regulatory protein [Proteobacteria bacterium]|nr:regulatory protein [Pseudomonadota bacterium]
MGRTYGIKQFEKVTGVSAHTLRFFDKIGLLSPVRSENTYRVYTLEQVSIAETIVLLQKALFSNAEIKEILLDYGSDLMIQRLKENRVKLRRNQINLNRVLDSVDQHIAYLAELRVIRSKLYVPFIAQLDARAVGLIRLPSNDIVDFFDAGDVIMKDPAWPHFKKHGFILPREKIAADAYPLETMFVFDRRVAKKNPATLAAGKYLCMYSDGSLENNARVDALVQQAVANGHEVGSPIVIEQVSGPVVEKTKSDFLIKILVPIA